MLFKAVCALVGAVRVLFGAAAGAIWRSRQGRGRRARQHRRGARRQEVVVLFKAVRALVGAVHVLVGAAAGAIWRIRQGSGRRARQHRRGARG